jgi:hypothetical protein
MRKLIACLLILGLAAPVWARDGEKSLAGASSKKDREAELDRLYEEAVAAKEAFLSDPTRTEENYYGDGATYSNYSAATQLYDGEESAAIQNKEVRGSYEPRAGNY